MKCRARIEIVPAVNRLCRELEELKAERDAALKGLNGCKDLADTIDADLGLLAHQDQSVEARLRVQFTGLLQAYRECREEKDAAQKACAEMREFIVHEYEETMEKSLTTEEHGRQNWMLQCLSTDCGKGYHHERDIESLVEALRYVAYQRLPLGNTVMDTLPEHWQAKVYAALAH